MGMLKRRLNVKVDECRWSRLERDGARRDLPIAVLAGEAIDESFPYPSRRNQWRHTRR
jgi:hypothetical protein